MKQNRLATVSNFLKYALLASATLYFVVYLFVVFSRISYPFELMWQEGASVDHVKRLVNGYKYYVRPSIEYVPSIYTPLYFYFSALVSKIMGVGYLPLRLVSFISSLGCFLFIFLFVKRETGNAYPAIIAAALFAATFQISGAWFDIGRPDSMFLFILLAALYLVRFNDTPMSYLLAGVLVSLSFMTKQTALVVALPVILYCGLINRKRVLYFITPIIVVVGFGSYLLNYIHDGWFNYYVFELPRTTPVNVKFITHFWAKDILLPLSIAFFTALFYMVSQMLNVDKKRVLFYFYAAAGMIGASWYSRIRGGGFYNVLFPAYTIISILFGLGLNKMLEISKSLDQDNRGRLSIFIYLICIAQFASGSIAYNPLTQIPSSQDEEAGRLLIRKMNRIEGDIFNSFHGYLNEQAGKKSYLNQMGMRDVLTTDSEDHEQIKAELISEISVAIKEKKFGAIIINSFEPWIPYDMDKYYVKKERIFSDETVFYPVTAMRTRPEFIYVPRPDTAQ